jgi:hypothetical protein
MALVDGQWVDASTTALDLAYQSGDTMAGALILPSGDPPSDAAAARKKYVDDLNRAMSLEAVANSWDSVTKPGMHRNLVHGTNNANGPGVGIWYYVTNYVYGGSVEQDLTIAHTRNLTQVAVPFEQSNTYATCTRSRYSSVWTAWSSPYEIITAPLTLPSGWKINNAAYPPYVERNGNAVTVRGIISPTADTAITSSHTVATLPSSIYCPPATLLTQLLAYTGTAYRPLDRVYVYGSGGIIVNSGHLGAYTMTTAGWFNFNLTYMVAN